VIWRRGREFASRVKVDTRKHPASTTEATGKQPQAKLSNPNTWLDGHPVLGRTPDPSPRARILAKLAEFAVPKLARVEYADAQDQAAQPMAMRVEFVDAPARAAFMMALLSTHPAATNTPVRQ